MTLHGTAYKTMALLALTVLAAAYTWRAAFLGNTEVVIPLMIGGGVVGLIAGLITCMQPKWAMATAPVYAIAEGLLLGAISAFYEAQFHGIVFQAVCLTFGTLFSLLLAYQTGMIQASENFKLGVVAATGGIFIVYLATMIMGWMGMSVPYIHGNGIVGICFSGFVVVIAALNLVLDFDFIEEGVEQQAPKYMEWYAAYGLMVTLVWLYMSILRLLAKLQSDD